MDPSTDSPAPSSPPPEAPPEAPAVPAGTPLSTPELTFLVLVSWLSLALLHRSLILGRIPVPHVRILGEGALELKGRFLFFAFANGLATDLVMFTLFAGPALAAWHVGARSPRTPRALRHVLFALPWLAIGVLATMLFANWMSFLTTDHAISFMMLAFFISDPRDLVFFIAREAGGMHALAGILALTLSVPAAIGFLLYLPLRALPAVRRHLRTGVRGRVVVALLVLQALFVGRAALGSDIQSLRGRYLYMVIREYEDPTWRVATGAIYVKTSTTIPRDLSKEEMAALRPVLTPGDDTPAIDEKFPLYRNLTFHGPRVIDIPRPETPPNVVLLLLESTGTSDTGLFGGTGESPTPCFDKLAGEGLLFRRYATNAADSTGAFFSVLTSTYPQKGRGRDGVVALRGSLPDVLTQNGYSAGFSHYESVSWDIISEYTRGMEVSALPQISRVWADDRKIYANMLDWIDLKAKEPWFATVFAGTHHSPWVLPDHRSWEPGIRDSKAASMRVLKFQDTELCKFVDEIRRRERTSDRRTLMVILGDHGNHISDETREINLSGLRQDTIHVPLLLHAPGWVQPGTSDVLGSHVDLLPTILDVLGIEGTPTPAVGKSLLRGGQERVFSMNGMSAGYLSLIRGDRKLVFDLYTGEVGLFRAFTDEPVPDGPEVSEPMLQELLALHRLSSWLLITQRAAPRLPESETRTKPGNHVTSWRETTATP